MIFDMGNQIALSIPDVKTPVIVHILAINNCGNIKIGLVIPTDRFALVLPFSVLLFI